MAKNAPENAPAPEAPEAAETPKKKSGLPKIAILAGALLAQVVLAYFLQKTFLFADVPGAHEVKAEAKKEEAKKEEGEEAGKIVLLDEIVVNPAETSGRRYLAVTVGLQTKAKEADKLIEENKPLIRDALISLLSSKHLDELARISYRDTLKTEIKEAVNKQLHDAPIQTIVFSGYVLQ